MDLWCKLSRPSNDDYYDYGEFLVNEKIRLLNIDLDNITMKDLVDNFERGFLLTLHVDMIMKLQKQKDFYDIISEFDVITCDSQILVVAGSVLGTPFKERVSGSDFFPLYCEKYKNDESIKVFLCGGGPGIAEIAAKNINERVGREIIVGTDSPPFDYDTNPEEVDRMINKINDSGATVLLVGLGAGRQEKFMYTNRHKLKDVHTFLPLGGTIDYEAKTLVRPAAWITDWGFEWLYRLLKEPKQRWHRYLVHQPPVLWLLLKQRLGLYKNPFEESSKTDSSRSES